MSGPSHPPPDPLLTPARRVWRYWVALLVPPVLWGGRLVAAWAVAEVACANGELGATYLIVQTGLIVLAVAPTVWSGLVAWRLWQGSGRDVDARPPDTFLAFSGVMSAVVFLLLILAEGSAVYVVGCG